MCRCWQIPLALGLTMFDLVTPNRFQKIPIAILDEKWIHLFVVITKKCVFWLKKYFFLRSRSLKTNNSFLVSFFFWQDIDFILMSREQTCMSLVKRVCILVCVPAGLTLLWPCLVLSPLSCLHLSPPKRRRKKQTKRWAATCGGCVWISHLFFTSAHPFILSILVASFVWGLWHVPHDYFDQ